MKFSYSLTALQPYLYWLFSLKKSNQIRQIFRVYALETMLFMSIIGSKKRFSAPILVKKNRRVRSSEPADALPCTRLNNGTKRFHNKIRNVK